MNTEPKYRTVTLTDAPPVKFQEDLWPVIATGKSDEPAVIIRVRQRQGSRKAIVYAVYEQDKVTSYRAGYLLESPTPEDLVRHIRLCQADLQDLMQPTEQQKNALRDVVHACIANLPAQDLDMVIDAPIGQCTVLTMHDQWTDQAIREFTLKAGGHFHGPHVETLSMPEERYFKMFRTILHGKGEQPKYDDQPSMVARPLSSF